MSRHFFYFCHFIFRTSFYVFRGGAKVTSLMKFIVLMSFLRSCLSCLSQWARQSFSAPLKIEQTVSEVRKLAVVFKVLQEVFALLEYLAPSTHFVTR